MDVVKVRKSSLTALFGNVTAAPLIIPVALVYKKNGVRINSIFQDAKLNIYLLNNLPSDPDFQTFKMPGRASAILST